MKVYVKFLSHIAQKQKLKKIEILLFYVVVVVVPYEPG